MALADSDIGTILVEESYLSQDELKGAIKRAKERNVALLNILTEQGLITQTLFESALCEHYKLEFHDLYADPPHPDIVSLLPEPVARKYNVIVVHKDGTQVAVATSDPTEPMLVEAVKLNLGRQDNDTIVWPKGNDKASATKGKMVFSISGSKKDDFKPFTGNVKVVYAGQTAIETTFHAYRKPLITRFQQIIEKQGKVAPGILEEIINDAIELRASDIHFEPQEKITIIRFRVDGVLHEAGRIPKPYYEGVVNRVKIASDMRTDEHFRPQDGAIRHETPVGKLDVRVSVVPVVDGEKIVMRLLASYVRSITLAELGFSDADQEVLNEAVQKPYGMVLTTGPTGSGKSTTLTALLKMRNTPDVNISTIEDPVEYKIPGVNHIQVNSEVNLTFASGLRALVRQDPNVILVGEIRDGETADIAVNAALTGHLLLSTLHANDAPTAVPRLLEMGVEPFLLASTLEVIIGQRLARRICSHCRTSYSLPAHETHTFFRGASKLFLKRGSVTLYKGKGCEGCGGTGFRGRTGIYELLVVTPEIEDAIIRRASSSDITVIARRQGMQSMFEDGFEKVLSGMTTIEELKRVAAPPDILLGSHGKSTTKN
jgi:type IV pilus assembly protein PilB